jgi:CRP-like cAMP-binding protein
VGPSSMFLFPEGGIIATMAVDGVRTEVGMVGREGMVGLSTILGGSELFESIVQVDGATALAIPADVLMTQHARSPALRQLMSHYLLHSMLQLSFSIVSRSNQMMEARLARWLLMCHDRMPADEIPVTHEFLATMISAQRSGVTVTLHLLEGEGLIRANRGRITIRDRAGLELLAGTTYGRAEATYSEFIGLFGKGTR